MLLIHSSLSKEPEWSSAQREAVTKLVVSAFWSTVSGPVSQLSGTSSQSEGCTLASRQGRGITAFEGVANSQVHGRGPTSGHLFKPARGDPPRLTNPFENGRLSGPSWAGNLCFCCKRGAPPLGPLLPWPLALYTCHLPVYRHAAGGLQLQGSCPPSAAPPTPLPSLPLFS